MRQRVTDRKDAETKSPKQYCLVKSSVEMVGYVPYTWSETENGKWGKQAKNEKEATSKPEKHLISTKNCFKNTKGKI